jgi:hypothetical protein
MNEAVPRSYFEMGNEDLEAAKMSEEIYREAIELAINVGDYFLRPLLTDLRRLPETPELELLKGEMERALRSPHIMPAKNPLYLLYQHSALLHKVAKYNTKTGKKSKTVEEPEEVDGLKEIVPENKTQIRAMVLLKQLKLNPEKALHTDSCKLLLEGAEGVALDSKVVRRAMEYLAETYNPKILYEKVDGSYRLRANV